MYNFGVGPQRQEAAPLPHFTPSCHRQSWIRSVKITSCFPQQHLKPQDQQCLGLWKAERSCPGPTYRHIQEQKREFSILRQCYFGFLWYVLEPISQPIHSQAYLPSEVKISNSQTWLCPRINIGYFYGVGGCVLESILLSSLPPSSDNSDEVRRSGSCQWRHKGDNLWLRFSGHGFNLSDLPGVIKC